MPSPSSIRSVPIPVYRILRSDRAAAGCPPPGTLVYPAKNDFGCALDDTTATGIEYVACSRNLSGLPFFTIARADIEEIGHVRQNQLQIIAVSADETRQQMMPTEPEGSGQYSVFQWFADGRWEPVGRNLAPTAAANLAVRAASSLGAQIGTTHRVIITDGGDCVNWEWEFGKGVVFPTPHDPAAPPRVTASP